MPIIHVPKETHDGLRILAARKSRRLGELAASILDKEIKKNYEKPITQDRSKKS